MMSALNSSIDRSVRDIRLSIVFFMILILYCLLSSDRVCLYCSCFVMYPPMYYYNLAAQVLHIM